MPQSSLMVAEGKITFAPDPDSVRRGVGDQQRLDDRPVHEGAATSGRSITLARKSTVQWGGTTYANALGWNRKSI